MEIGGMGTDEADGFVGIEAVTREAVDKQQVRRSERVRLSSKTEEKEVEDGKK
jgi:hypothetical protein